MANRRHLLRPAVLVLSSRSRLTSAKDRDHLLFLAYPTSAPRVARMNKCQVGRTATSIATRSSSADLIARSVPDLRFELGEFVAAANRVALTAPCAARTQVRWAAAHRQALSTNNSKP
jgi:hypothetical protein